MLKAIWTAAAWSMGVLGVSWRWARWRGRLTMPI